MGLWASLYVSSLTLTRPRINQVAEGSNFGGTLNWDSPSSRPHRCLIMRSLAVPVFSHAIPIGLRRRLITRYASHLPKSWDITNLGQVHEPENAGTAITGTIRIGKAMHGDSRRNWSRFLVPHTSDGSVIYYSFSIAILLHCDCQCSLLPVAVPIMVLVNDELWMIDQLKTPSESESPDNQYNLDRLLSGTM